MTPGRRGRAARAGDLLVAVDGLVDDPAAIEGIVVGRGPGSFTSIRIGLAMARTLALALDVPVAGVSTLEAFAGGTPVLDARRGEVFTTGPRVCKPEELDVAGQTLVGDGAVRYRALFEERGGDGPARRRRRPSSRDPLLLVERAGPSARRSWSSRSTSATPTRSRCRDRRRARDPQARRSPISTRSRASSSARTRRRGRARCSRRSSRSPRRSVSARSRASDLVGYVINSRYVDAWHVMNVAVDPEHQRRGIATALLERLFALTRDDERRGYTLEVRVSNDGRDPALRAARLRVARHPPRLLHGQPGGRADHVARQPSDERNGSCCVILGIETCCDETAAALVTADGEIASNVVASQAELHARFGGVVPEVATRRHLELDRARDSGGAGAGDAREVEAVAVTAAPRPDRGAARRASRLRRRSPGRARLPLIPVNHLHGHVASLYLQPLDLEPPFTCLLASGGHTMLVDVRAARRLPRARDDARRRCRRGVRQGRPAARARLPGRQGDRRARALGDPTAYDFPVARVPGSTSRSRA